MNDIDSELVIVAGMHRSGTSLICRILGMQGYELGNNLLEGIENINDDGFWEDQEVMSINERLFELLSTSWFDIGCLFNDGKPALSVDAINILWRFIKPSPFRVVHRIEISSAVTIGDFLAILRKIFHRMEFFISNLVQLPMILKNLRKVMSFIAGAAVRVCPTKKMCFFRAFQPWVLFQNISQHGCT